METNTEYSVSISEEAKSWISVVESRAISQETIKLSVAENIGEARSADIFMINEKGEQLAKIQITQREAPYFMVKNGTTIDVERIGGTIELNLETNIEYSISIPEEVKSWISVMGARAISQETVTLSISENLGDARTATIQFVDKDNETLALINIEQAERIIYNNIPSDLKIAFPDKSFRGYVLAYIDLDKNGVISEDEALEITEINVNNRKEIKSLEGIQYFKNIEYLYCNDNQLTALDVSKNTALTRLYCNDNQLTSLDVSGCAALTGLSCYDNRLTSLDVSNCTKLTSLSCYNNQLTSLDVSGYTALTHLKCYDNQLTSLDVTGCTAMNFLTCNDNQLTSLDVSRCTKLLNLTCHNNQLTSLDVSGYTKLAALYCGNNQLTSLDVTGCTALTTLDCYNNQLTSLDVSGCTKLNYLHCYKNQLTSLDVSGFTTLNYLHCYNNQLTSLDVTGCTALNYLYCYDNQLTSLDVSGCTKLKYLRCKNNQLISLDVSRCPLAELSCNMPSLEFLFIKKEADIRGITYNSSDSYINPETTIRYI